MSVLAEELVLFFTHHRNLQAAAAVSKGCFDGVCYPRAGVRSSDQPVDNNLDLVPAFLVEFNFLIKRAHFAVDPQPCESVSLDSFEQLTVLSFTIFDDRRQQEILRPLGQRHQRINNLFSRLRLDNAVALVASLLADASVQDAEIVVNLGDCTDR